jgi:hypothetical protein
VGIDVAYRKGVSLGTDSSNLLKQLNWPFPGVVSSFRLGRCARKGTVYQRRAPRENVMRRWWFPLMMLAVLALFIIWGWTHPAWNDLHDLAARF